jgi:N utilization substance protein A
MMTADFMEALQEVMRQKGIPEREIIGVVERALGQAYRRRYGADARIHVEVEPKTHQTLVFVEKDVVEAVTDQHMQVSVADARRSDAKAEVGDILQEEISPEQFGRIGAQVAKQTIFQRLRELERDLVYDEYSRRVDAVVTGEVQRRDDRGNIFVSLGRAEALLPKREQVESERYRFAERMKFLVLEARQTTRTAQVILSRAHPDLVAKLLELEVPEIGEGVVQVAGVARKPGARTKIAVRSNDAKVDPVGACIGSQGARAMAVANELRGEKIEIVRYSDEPREYLANALSPAKVREVHVSPETRVARVVVPDDQLSLAIGRGGHNVRLAAKLTGWNITLQSASEAATGREGLLFDSKAEAESRSEEAASAEAGASLASAPAADAGQPQPGCETEGAQASPLAEPVVETSGAAQDDVAAVGDEVAEHAAAAPEGEAAGGA